MPENGQDCETIRDRGSPAKVIYLRVSGRRLKGKKDYRQKFVCAGYAEKQKSLLNPTLIQILLYRSISNLTGQ